MPAAFSQHTSAPGTHTVGSLPGPRPSAVSGLLALLLPGAIPLIVFALWGVEPSHELPSYHLSLACEGCSSRELPRCQPQSVLDLSLRPSTRVDGPIGVRAALLYDTGIEPWPVAFAKSPAGTFRLRRPVQDLSRLRPGLRRMVFAVGSPADLPDTLHAEWMPTSSKVQLLSQPIEIAP